MAETSVIDNIKKRIEDIFDFVVKIDKGIIKFNVKHNNIWVDENGKLNQSAKEKLDELLSDENKKSEHKYYYEIKENTKSNTITIRESDTILINIMYTGDYTNKNIGHEIINLYKTDEDTDESGNRIGGENYLYISPYGYVTSDWDNRIKTILYTRSAGKNKLEIIAKAEPDEQLVMSKKGRPELSLSGGKELTKLKNAWKKNVKQNDVEYINFMQALKDWEKKCRNKIQVNASNVKIEELMNDFPSYDINNNFEKYKQEGNREFTDWEESYTQWKKRYFEWLRNNAEEHLNQLKIIYKDNVKYGEKFLCDIFKENYGDENAIYLGYKTTKISMPEKTIYIEYNTDDTNKKTKFNERSETNNENNDEKDVVTYHFEHAKIKNQSCNFYINRDRTENFDTFELLLNNEKFDKKINTLKESEEHNKIEYYDKTLITIMGKQNDELAYSNMLAYYLNDKDIFKKFAKKILDFKDELSFENTFEIKREYQNIDLLIDTDDDVFIIENKIKSGINGEKYDPYNGTYSNQLIKYCDIVDEDEIYKSKKNKHFYIFKPNYSDIDLKRLKDVDILEENLEEDNNKGKNDNKKEKKYIKLTNEQKEKIEKWKIKNYLEIYKFFEDKEKENEEILKNKNLLEQFVKALSLHIDSNENIIEQEMEYKFRQAIEKAK